MSGPGSLLDYRSCFGELRVPCRGQRVRRSSQFQSFNDESFISERPGAPVPFRVQVQTTSPARIARLLLVAYRTRHIPLSRQNIAEIGQTPRVYISPKCNRDIIVEERSRVLETGRRARNNGETQCITRTVYRNCLCSAEQVEMALRDMCRVQSSIDQGDTTFAGIVSGCEQCEELDQAANPCILCKKNTRTQPAGPNTVLTEDDITKIINWYTTGKSFEPPAQ